MKLLILISAAFLFASCMGLPDRTTVTYSPDGSVSITSIDMPPRVIPSRK